MIWGIRKRASPSSLADGPLEKVLEKLSSLIPNGRTGDGLRESIAAFRESSPVGREERFVPVYLLIEQWLAQSEKNQREARARLRQEILDQYPSLPLEPLIAPIFASEKMQELLLQKRFLEEFISAALDGIGSAGENFLRVARNQIQESADVLPPESPMSGLVTDSPGLEVLSRSIFGFLSVNLGETAAVKLLDFAYERTSRLYRGLERFPVVLRMIPEQHLNDEKIALLSRDQMERTLADNIRELGARNEQLAAINLKLVIAQSEIDDAKSSLEEAVKERTVDLERSRSLNRAITESVPDAIVAANGKGKLIAWNAGAERMFGYTHHELEDKMLSDLMPVRYREKHEMGMARIAQGADSRLAGQTLALHGLRKNGEEFPLDLSIGVWQSEGQRYFSGVMRDTSERALAESRTLELQDQLRQFQKMEALGRLAGGVAHDFNNVLTVIRGNADLLLDDLSNPGAIEEGVNEIRAAADHAAELTMQLLAVSRTQPHHPQVLDLCAQVRELEPMLRRVIEERIDLQVEAAPGPCNVTMDATQAMQVVLNLVINAKDAMPDGGRLLVEIGATVMDQSQLRNHAGKRPGSYVRLRISDTGSGISEELAGRIFEPFFTTKSRGSGTGLGLSVVYGIVEQAGGFIEVGANEGRGARFDVYLPESNERAQPAAATPEAEAFGGNEFVLVIEDQPNLRALVRRILVKSGYDVIDAAGNADAVRLLDQRGYAPHLVVTDVVMPEMGGPEIVKRLTQRFGELKVLFMSGYTGDLAAADFMARSHFLAKPFTPSDLLSKTREALDSQLVVRAADFSEGSTTFNADMLMTGLAED